MHFYHLARLNKPDLHLTGLILLENVEPDVLFSGGNCRPSYGAPGDAGRGSWPGPCPLRQFTWDLEYPEIDGNTGTPGEAPGGRV